MCGELDGDVLVNEEIYTQFLATARMIGAENSAAADPPPSGLNDATGRATYMDRLFKETLCRAIGDVNAANDSEKVDALASQAIAFARLAGFIAGQLPPDADLFRPVIEALTAGHGEPRDLIDARRGHHDHHHNHGNHGDHDGG
jgi:hypothetical protein